MPKKMTPQEEQRATDAALAKLYAKAGVSNKPAAKPAEKPAARPSMIQNYQTLGKKMAESGRKAFGKKK